ncbi:MAG: hypothetical protein GXO43_02225 [Crenarchaeota archaeon]|nr:hypothetical protein [Thermoproteota archaeon]
MAYSPKSYTFKDVLWALKTIDKYSKFKEAIDGIVKQLAVKGVRLSDADLQNPTTLLPLFTEAKRMGIDIDLSDIESVVNDIGTLSFDDVSKALQILSAYNNMNNRVDSTFRQIVRRGGMSMEQMTMFAQMFGFSFGGSAQSISSDTEVDMEVDPEDYEELSEFIRSLKNRNK